MNWNDQVLFTLLSGEYLAVVSGATGGNLEVPSTEVNGDSD